MRLQLSLINKGLSKEIGVLTEELVLDHNDLVSLPNELGKLTNLQLLSAACNKLTSLPRTIANLMNLRELNLFENQLKILPNEIGNMTNLRRLFLERNCLTSVPKQIGNLTKLCELTLYGNRLTSLPVEIGDLTKLWCFTLGSNQEMTIYRQMESATLNQWRVVFRNRTMSMMIGDFVYGAHKFVKKAPWGNWMPRKDVHMAFPLDVRRAVVTVLLLRKRTECAVLKDVALIVASYVATRPYPGYEWLEDNENFEMSL